MTEPCIVTAMPFRLIEEDFKGAIQEGPTYICNIFWKFRSIKKYQTDIYSNHYW